MAGEQFKSTTVYDFLGNFAAGHNSGIDPDLLPKDQLADSRNVTVRGTFATHRPAYRRTSLSFASGIQPLFESQLWQGGGYYKPVSGQESLLASIGGRLFQITPDSSGGASVADKTIPGDPNPASLVQAWIWQSERWGIVNDGQSLPLFFDGNATRRSYGPAVSLGTTSANFTVPAVGSSVQITLSSNYTGAYNIPVTIGVGRYQVSTGVSGNSLTLQNMADAAGTAYVAGTPINSSNFLTYVQSFVDIGGGIFDVTLVVPHTFGVSAFTRLVFSRGTYNDVYRYQGQSSPNVVRVQRVSTGVSPTHGEGIRLESATAPTISLGTLASPLTAPAIDGTVVATLSQAYSGQVNVPVTINNKNYLITAIGANPVASNQIYVVNLTDVPGNTVTSGKSLLTLSELPAGRMGAYGRGRNWMSLTDARSFMAGDLVGGSSGSQSYSYTDAVLKSTENTYLNGGGYFIVPGNVGDIRALSFTATLDASLGQGPLQVFTPNIVFSCNAPVDRTIWQNLTNPILTESVIGAGGQGQWSTAISNGDALYRSDDGLRSLILARRDFDTWGNVPISREVDAVLSLDDQALLNYTSQAVFDNRSLLTASPTQGTLGVYFTKLIALNFDPISSLRGKAPSVYDGIWDGLNIFQLVPGTFGNVKRLFAFCYNVAQNTIELYELLTSASTTTADDSVTPIVWEIVSPTLFNQGISDPGKRQYLRMMDGEIFVDRLSGEVQFEAFYKPNEWPVWIPWFSWTARAASGDPGYRPRMGLGEPTNNAFDDVNNTSLREGYSFQFKLVVHGHCRFKGARFKANTVPVPDFAQPKEVV